MTIKLIDGWRSLWRAWTVQLAALGIALPELLQLVADNTDALAGFDAGWKSVIRLACLVGVVLLRPVKQVVLEPKA